MASLATNDAPDAHAHHDEEEIHLPEPNIWPLIVAIGLGFLPVGALLTFNTSPDQILAAGIRAQALGLPVALTGVAIALIGAFGWVGLVIREKPTLDTAWGNRVLSLGWKLFLLSEAAIFGAFFGHYGYIAYSAKQWPPAGTPEIHLLIPALGTIILVSSSLTCELGHKALLANRRSACKSWLMLTLLLGVAFLGLQGYEWGLLMNYAAFTPQSGVIGTLFYLITGFHGAHVITGLLLLTLVYARLELGSLDRKRHFSLNAASWYWHFVDVIWIFVFLFLYVGIQK